MTREDSQFDFSLASDIDTFDPLLIDDDDDDDEDYDEEPGALSIRDLEAEQAPQKAIRVDTRTPFEKTTDLIKQMPSQRKVLLGILDFCQNGQTAADTYARVDALQEYNPSVFTADVLCGHLEQAGALELVTEDGQPYEGIEMEPKLVEVDGVEYYEAQEPPTAYWRTAEAGLEALAADKPFERLDALFEENAKYSPIYREVLHLCAQEGGATTAMLSAAVDKDPLVQSPRRYAPYFIDGLEKCDAVEWKGSWQITEVGHGALERLSEALDAANDATPAE